MRRLWEERRETRHLWMMNMANRHADLRTLGTLDPCWRDALSKSCHDGNQRECCKTVGQANPE